MASFENIDVFENLGPDLYGYRGPYEKVLRERNTPDDVDCEISDSQILRASEAIRNADYLLVAAGAGLGVDSGLATYMDIAKIPGWQTQDLTYDDLCNPCLQQENPDIFYGFWCYSHNTYANNEPHQGYSILKKWCDEKTIKYNKKKAIQKGNTDGLVDVRVNATFNPASPWSTSRFLPWFVYTSNVDGHFKRAGFCPSNVLELHGSLMSSPQLEACDERASETGNQSVKDSGWFCTSCHPPNGTKEIDVVSFPINHHFQIDPVSMKLVGSKDSITHCPKCGGRLRPFVHMFSENHNGLLKKLAEEEERYVAWECEMEKGVCLDNDVDSEDGDNLSDSVNVCIIEIGCGLRVPSIRMETETVLADILNKLTANGKGVDTTNRVSLVRINRDFPEAPLPSFLSLTGDVARLWPHHTIECRGGALQTLHAIDTVLMSYVS